MTSSELLHQLFDLCDWETDMGRTQSGASVRRHYRSNGNWDIYVDGCYVGTWWVS